jgi:hypothetical protein
MKCTKSLTFTALVTFRGPLLTPSGYFQCLVLSVKAMKIVEFVGTDCLLTLKFTKL